MSPNSYLVFSTAEHRMGLPASEVAEIIPMVPLTSVPAMPSCLAGFLDWDDGTPPLPILRVGQVLHVSPTQVLGLHTPIIVLRNVAFGLLVESVSGFVTGTMATDNDNVSRSSFNGCVLGLLNPDDSSEGVPILSVERLLLAEEKERLDFFQQLLAERKSVLDTS